MADRTYTTTQNEAWDEIARALWGSERYMNRLLDANRKHASNIRLPAGVVLTVPEVDTDARDTVTSPWDR